MKIAKDQIKIIEKMLSNPSRKAKISNEQFIEALIHARKWLQKQYIAGKIWQIGG